MAAKTQYGPWGVPLQRYGSFAGKTGSASLFTNVRVEAQQFRSAIIRWDYAGIANPVSIYRSTDGSSYSLLDATIDPDDGEYLDEGLDDGTLYYYKLSDDSGTSFSSAVFVVTYVTLVGQVVNQASFSLRDSLGLEGIGPLVGKLEARARADDSQNPCILCSHNQALVVRCSDECTAYRVILTEDINSISFIGCDEFDCPRIEFITPPGETYGVCGWPVNCDFVGDECYDAPTDGGTLGSSDWSDGIKFPAPGGDNQLDPGCPCTRGGVLSIRCCSGSCDLTCGEGTSARLKACGGLGPYSWTATGDVRLSSANKDSVTVTRINAAGTPGVFPGVVAQYRGRVSYGINECDGCPGSTPSISLGAGLGGLEYDCDGVAMSERAFFTGTNRIGASPYPNVSLSLEHSEEGCTSVTENMIFPPSAMAKDGCDCEGGSLTMNINVATAGITCVNGTVWSGAVPLIETVTDMDDHLACADSPVTQVSTQGFIDVRTQEMIDGGCSFCDEEAVTVTVTDALGRNATVILTT